MNKSTKKPYYVGYDVQETKNGKIWLRVATAWPHRNGQDGFNVALTSLPLSGKLVFLPPKGKGKPAVK